MITDHADRNSPVITDHADRNNCIIDWEQAMVIDRESNRNVRWIREATWIRKMTTTYVVSIVVEITSVVSMVVEITYVVSRVVEII